MTNRKAERRSQIVASHVGAFATVAPQSDSPRLEVTFDGTRFHDVEPLSTIGRARWEGFEGSPQPRRHLDGQRMAETGGSQFWRISGKMYDLDDFLDRHPGGRMWLELTRGTDATAAVQAYHLDFPKVQAILAAHYVRDVEPGEFDYGDRYTFAEDGFYSTLRRRLLQRLKEEAGPGATTREATAATPAMKAASVAVLSQFSVAHFLACTTGSPFAAMLAGYFMVGMWGVGHNFMHQADAKAGIWKYAMDTVGNFSTEWRISHGLSHHLDTNLPTDLEQYILPAYEQTRHEWRLFPVMAPLFSFLVTIGQSVMYCVSTVKEACAPRTDQRTLSHLICGSLPLLQLYSYARSRGSWKQAVRLYMAQCAVFVLAFVPPAVGVHHSAVSPGSDEEAEMHAEPHSRGTLAWIEGQQGAAEDFGEHQVWATTDHSVYSMQMPEFLRNYLSLTLFGFLNNHTLHHLFPGVDASRLLGKHDLLMETAKEFNIPAKFVKVRPAWAVHNGFYRYIMKKVARPRL